MCSYASNQGDISGRMRRWEPCYFGPELKNSQDIDAWSKIEYSEPIKIKQSRCPSPDCGNALDING